MRFNDYTCTKCGKKTITRNEDDVVSPFIFSCGHCGGMAQSSFFRNEQFLASMQDHPEAKATHEFYYDWHKGSHPNDQLSVKEVT